MVCCAVTACHCLGSATAVSFYSVGSSAVSWTCSYPQRNCVAMHTNCAQVFGQGVFGTTGTVSGCARCLYGSVHLRGCMCVRACVCERACITHTHTHTYSSARTHVCMRVRFSIMSVWT